MSSKKMPIFLQMVVLLTLSAVPADAGPFRRLPAIDEIPALAELRRTEAALPHTLHLIPVSGGEGRQPFRIAMEEIGSPKSDRVLVMIHGALSDRRSWDLMAGDLGRDNTLLLVDLLGCGDSSRPDPATLGPGGYDPTAQARRLLEALRFYVGSRVGATRLTLVGHSLGGAVVLRIAGDPELRREFGDVIDRVDQLVLFAPLDVAVEKADPTLAKVARLGKVKVGIASMFGLLRKETALIATRSYVDPAVATKEDARRLLDILRRRKSRRPAQAILVQAVPFDPETTRPRWDEIERLVADYGNVDLPCLIVWGSRDEVLPASMGYKLRAQLPNARLRIVRESKHSLPRERPRLAASLLRDFLLTSGEGWESVEEVDPPREAALGMIALHSSRGSR